MNKRIDDLLRELYLIDPSLRSEEEALKKTIAELLESKPDGTIDAAFEARLKERLLAEFSKKAAGPTETAPRKNRFLLARPAFRLGLGAAAAVALIAGIYLGLGPKAGFPRLTGDTAGPVAQVYKSEPLPKNPAEKIKALSGKPVVASRPRAAAGSIAAAPNAAASTAAASTAAPLEAASLAEGVAPKDDDLRLSANYGAAPAQPSVDKTAAGQSAGQVARKQAATEAEARDELRQAAPLGEAAEVSPDGAAPDAAASVLPGRNNPNFNTEGYDRIVESSFAKVLEEPLSTFSIDVDTASYSNVRRFLREGSLPPPDAVRIEELVNYFPYDYAGPPGTDRPIAENAQARPFGAADKQPPFAFDSELSPCPWNPAHGLLRVALQAKRIADAAIPSSNLVFLIDVSGSMDEEGKLPLVKQSLKLLANRMRPQDRISLVVYAGAAGVVLEPTPGSRKDKILAAIDNLEAGGSTAGGEGIRLAYETAKRAFIPQGSNRVILATDGDFNVGPSSDGELVRIIEDERKAGVYLTVLGFGMGNYQDSKMQKLADTGNGNYAYIDSLSEADKVLSRQMAGTIYTVAKDVKVQIEFNPKRVGEYRLVGYEKRVLAARDFADDAKDAGELGAGSSVTAFYELVPPSGATARTDLKYQSATVVAGASAAELMTIKFRYKKPDAPANGQASPSILVEQPVAIDPADLAKCSSDFRFAAAVAEWGLVLRQSAYKGGATLEQAASIARGALGRDPGGYRAEFLELVRVSQKLSR